MLHLHLNHGVERTKIQSLVKGKLEQLDGICMACMDTDSGNKPEDSDDSQPDFAADLDIFIQSVKLK